MPQPSATRRFVIDDRYRRPPPRSVVRARWHAWLYLATNVAILILVYCIVSFVTLEAIGPSSGWLAMASLLATVPLVPFSLLARSRCRKALPLARDGILTEAVVESVASRHTGQRNGAYRHVEFRLKGISGDWEHHAASFSSGAPWMRVGQLVPALVDPVDPARFLLVPDVAPHVTFAPATSSVTDRA